MKIAITGGREQFMFLSFSRRSNSPLLLRQPILGHPAGDSTLFRAPCRVTADFEAPCKKEQRVVACKRVRCRFFIILINEVQR
jgi:hypothetical protein